MTNLFDKRAFVTGLALVICAFLLKKLFTKTLKNADGSTSSYIGNDAIGYV